MARFGVSPWIAIVLLLTARSVLADTIKVDALGRDFVQCSAFTHLSAEVYGRKGNTREQSVRQAASKVFRVWAGVLMDHEAFVSERVAAEQQVLADFFALSKSQSPRQNTETYFSQRTTYCVDLFTRHDPEMRRRVKEFARKLRESHKSP